ncbi:MAG: TAXI family TRAP transporter solute-binding subunit [Acidobacteria bacterium]|nr:MAG: TAXI family TRAP transporter solute-binding subunit [Acidobacteriota bacterium]
MIATTRRWSKRGLLSAFIGARGAPPPLAAAPRLRSSQRPQALCLLLSGACLFFLSCSGQSGGKTRLSIATGGTGGVYYPYGGGIAKIITAYIPNVEATAEVTAASVDNLKFLRDRKADLAFTTADTLADAVNGTEAFEGNRLPLRALAVLYANYTQVVTLESSSIETIGDLKGKVVSTGAAGSGTEVTAFRVLQAFGIEPLTGIVKQSLGVSQSVDALKDGKVDAFFWSGGLPTGAILDLAHTPGLRIRMLASDAAVPGLRRAHGDALYAVRPVPKTTYPGLSGDVPVVSVANILAVHENLPDQLAYDITRTLFEHQSELAAIHPEAKNLSIQSAVQGSPAPFHPGALRYYQEKNVSPQ